MTTKSQLFFAGLNHLALLSSTKRFNLEQLRLDLELVKDAIINNQQEDTTSNPETLSSVLYLISTIDN